MKKTTNTKANGTASLAAIAAAMPASVRGVKATWQGDVLVLAIDCSASAVTAAPLSKSGKSRLLASTHGFAYTVRRDGAQVGVSLNVNTR